MEYIRAKIKFFVENCLKIFNLQSRRHQDLSFCKLFVEYIYSESWKFYRIISENKLLTNYLQIGIYRVRQKTI